LQEDGAAILASTAADFGLQDRQQLVEAVRTQDWEQSIRVCGSAGRMRLLLFLHRRWCLWLQPL
jgi:hypothetical protein